MFNKIWNWMKGSSSEVEVEAVEPVKKVIKAEHSLLSKSSLSKMTKVQLEALGREYGHEIDRRHRKDDLVKEVYKLLQK